MTNQQTVEALCAYSYLDEALQKELEQHLRLLRQQGVISNWHNRMFAISDGWKDATDTFFDHARIILLLVSPDFLASDYCYGQEMTRALERHAAGEARVILVILRPCDWHDAPFGKLQALPRDGKPITTWANRDEALLDVARGIRAVVQSERGQRTTYSGPARQDERPLGGINVMQNIGTNSGTVVGVQIGTVDTRTGAAQPVTTILFMAADPSDQARLRIGQEAREIRERVRLATQRDRFRFEDRLSVRIPDLTGAILETHPHIVHFCGHGASMGALLFEDELGHTQEVEPEALADLFRLISDEVECVILNACYSEAQALAIGQYISFVIGTTRRIPDASAIYFTVGFYQALGEGKSIPQAFEWGKAQMRLRGTSDHRALVLHEKGKPASGETTV